MSGDLKAGTIKGGKHYIPKGTKINSVNDTIVRMPSRLFNLNDIYESLALANENQVDGKVYMTSVQPPDALANTSKEVDVSETAMKITRRQLRQIIQEAARKSEPVTVEISIESGDLSKDKIQFNSKIANTFYALRPRSQIAKLKIGEKLVFNVAKFWSAEIAPDGSKTTLWDGPIEKARNLIWGELPTDDVILKVTYSTPQVERSAGRNLNMTPEQLRQFVKEELNKAAPFGSGMKQAKLDKDQKKVVGHT